ncbi:MAG: sulfite reductase subunit alpha [Azospirillum sp.]|nr:sulfite reductase subunit alpha [Azospirillum sp.]
MPPMLIPDTAPFNPTQRAWLNGFFAGLFNGADAFAAAPPGFAVPSGIALAAPPPEVEEVPWHDPGLALDERMALAEGRSLPLRMMAAMGQLDCGQCGYDCRDYAAAIAEGREAKLTLCQPGGRDTQKILRALHSEIGSQPIVVPSVAKSAAKPGPSPTVAVPVLESRKLNGPGSARDTRHVAFDLAGSGLSYQPGDSLGVHAENCPELVRAVVSALGATGAEPVGDGGGGTVPLAEALADRYDLFTPTPEFLTVLASVARDRSERRRLEALAADQPGGSDRELLDVLDILSGFPSTRPPLREIAASLGELRPRLYSIASSQRAVGEQVHLTVGVATTEHRGRRRKGVASTFLAERAVGRKVRVYVQPSHGFRLPADAKVPIVMIGPGTGVAPFLGFLQERRATAAAGGTWLFFGNPHAASDFLYQQDLEAALAEGSLTRLDTAFSRDQAEKLYVQHRLDQAGAELWAWLQRGAHVYVCGDAKRMARDVDQSLRSIVARHGAMADSEAKAFIMRLTKDGRYQRDVY